MLKLSGLNAQKTPGLSPQGPLPAFLTTCPPLSSIRTLCAMCDSLVYFCGTPRVMKLGVFFLSAWQKVATEWWIWAFYRGLLWSCSARHQHQVISLTSGNQTSFIFLPHRLNLQSSHFSFLSLCFLLFCAFFSHFSSFAFCPYADQFFLCLCSSRIGFCFWRHSISKY